MCKKYLDSINKLTCELIKNKISKQYVEFEKEKFPESRGVYFIYKKKENGSEDEPVYIGCAYKKGDNSGIKDRSIRDRCGQNLNETDNGATFRNRVMKEEMKLDVYKEIEVDGKKKKEIDVGNSQKGMKYIKDNFVLKFIEVDENMSENEVLLLERACINYYNPIYNRG